MALSKEKIIELYTIRAKNYDITANLYYLIGFRESKYREQAVSQLNLKPGDTVIEIGCGTGLNFSYVRQYINNTGQLIGVDLTEAMLEIAASKISENGWKNIQLIKSDAAGFAFPAGINGVFSTFALTLMPEYELIIERVSQALVDDGRFVILDFKKPDWCPLWIAKLGVVITRPFGVTLDLAERKPWQVMKRYFQDVIVKDIYGGFIYIAVGKK